MALLGQAAMILSFDVVSEAIVEHDDWHSHEHLPERLAIPGFRRGSRWTALDGNPRYFVMYEVSELETLASTPYLERLNNPSPWTAKMMTQYRGMKRGFCRLAASSGVGLGRVGLLLRFKPAPEKETSLRDWLSTELMPALPARPGLCSVHLFESALPPDMTKEQSIRGNDAGVDWVLFVTGYSTDVVVRLAENHLSATRLGERNAVGTTSAIYQLDHSLTDREVGMRRDCGGGD